MEGGGNEKEVLYFNYCSKCKYRTLPENEEPCETCLSEPSNLDSHKPIKFERGGNNSGGKKNAIEG